MSAYHGSFNCKSKAFCCHKINHFNFKKQSEKEKDEKNIWKLRKEHSSESLFDSTSDNIIDLESDLGIDANSFLMPNYSQEDSKFAETKAEKMKKLQIVKLDSISVSSFSAHPQPYNSSLVVSTQTCIMDSTDNNSMPAEENDNRRRLMRATTLPPENIALTHLQNRVEADVKSNSSQQMIGDGDKNISPNYQNDLRNTAMRQPDLEITNVKLITPVQCEVIKPK